MGLFRVRRLFNSGAYSEAIPLLEARLKENLSQIKLAEASYMLGSAHVMLGSFEEGINELQNRCIPAFGGHKRGVTYGRALYALGYALSASGRWKAGLEVLLECREVIRGTKQELEEARVLNHLAQCFLNAKDDAKAEILLLEARTILDGQKIDLKSMTATLIVRNSVVMSKIRYARGEYALAREAAFSAENELKKITSGDPLLAKEIAALLARPDRRLTRIPTFAAAAGAAIIAICGVAAIIL